MFATFLNLVIVYNKFTEGMHFNPRINGDRGTVSDCLASSQGWQSTTTKFSPMCLEIIKYSWCFLQVGGRVSPRWMQALPRDSTVVCEHENKTKQNKRWLVRPMARLSSARSWLCRTMLCNWWCRFSKAAQVPWLCFWADIVVMFLDYIWRQNVSGICTGEETQMEVQKEKKK